MNTELKGENSSRQTFIKLVILETIIFAAILIANDVKYEVSDDFIMELMMSGVYSGHVNLHLLFSNYFWGLFLSIFYHLNSSISWYLVWQLAICFMSNIALVRVLSKRMKLSSAAGLILIFNLGTAMDLYILPQFTRTAAVALISGGILFLQAVFDRNCIVDCIFGAILLIAGSFIRFKMFYAALPFLSVYAMFLLVENKNNTIGLKSIGAVLILLMVVFSCRSVGRALNTQSAEYSYFSKWTSVRSKYIDYIHPEYEEISDKLDQIGITENTYNMINNWQYPDPEDPDFSKMEKLLDIVQNYRSEKTFNILSLMKSVKNRGVLKYPGTLICIFIGLAGMLIKKRGIIIPVICAGILSAYFMYFAFVGRQVYRAESACLILAAAIMISSFSDQKVIRRNQYINITLLVISAAILLPLYIPLKAVSSNTANIDKYRKDTISIFYHSGEYDPLKYRSEVREDLLFRDLINKAESDPNVLYILDFDTSIQTIYYAFVPFVSAAHQFPSNLIYMGGVLANHPDMNSYMQRLGYNSWAEALLADNVFYVCNNRPEMMLGYFSEHGYNNVYMLAEDSFDGLSVYSFRERSK